jgi:predicted transcriptional regulator
MSDRDRDQGGQYVQERDPSDVLGAMTPGEPYVTSELADELDWPRRTVYKTLSELHEADRIQKKQANARAVMWIRLPEGDGS